MTRVDIKKLSKLAIAARKNAYCPYSHHPVGVALVSASGQVYTGCNIETANYKGYCAEGTAISAMVMAGEHKISKVIVVGPVGGGICAPCGDCRQRIYEFADKNTEIHSLMPDGSPGKVHKIDDLLPMAFGPKNLKKIKKK